MKVTSRVLRWTIREASVVCFNKTGEKTCLERWEPCVCEGSEVGRSLGVSSRVGISPRLSVLLRHLCVPMSHNLNFLTSGTWF